MDKLFLMARGYNRRFPDGNEPFKMMTRLLEECGEVAQEVNLWEDTGIKRLKHGEPQKENLANEIRQAMGVLAQIAVYYNVENEIVERLDKSLEVMKNEGLFD